MTISDEQLAAFADGELSGDDHARVAAAIAADPALAEIVARHRGLRDRLAARFTPVVDEPVPDRLTAMLTAPVAPLADNVVRFAPREGGKQPSAAAPKRWRWVIAPALAASLALAIFLPRTGEGPESGMTEGLAQQLDGQLVADQGAEADPRILLSFQRADGGYCRAFAGTDQSGIACREDSGWLLVETAAGGAARSGDYRQAGSAEVMALAQEMAVGGALDAEGERRAKLAGWRAE